jgi:hypothetical protein
MFLGAYHFDGPPDELIPAYERLLAGFPPDSLELHICVVREGGLTVFDTCPSSAVFAAFSTSADFADAVRAAGLPEARVEPLGDVHATRVRAGVAP